MKRLLFIAALLSTFASDVFGAAGWQSDEDTRGFKLFGNPYVVANVTALEAVTGTTLWKDGAVVRVQSVQADFVFQATSSATVDHITVASVAGAAGSRWIREVAANRYWWGNATWAIDTANGSDEAACTSAATACKTLGEIKRRWWGAEITTDTTVSVLGNISSTEVYGWNFTIATGKFVQFRGSLGATTGFGGASINNALYTGSVTGFVAGSDVPAAADIELTDSAIPTSYTASGLLASGVIFRRTNSTAWYWYALKDLGSKTVRTTLPHGDLLNSNMTTTLTVGDTYEADAEWTMPRQDWNVSTTGGASASFPNRGFGQIQIWNLHETGPQTGPGPGSSANAPRRHRVWIDQPTPSSSINLSVTNNCMFEVTTSEQWSFAYDVPVQVQGGGARGTGSTTISVFGTGGIGSPFVSQGVGFRPIDRAYFAIEGSFAIHDMTVPAFALTASARMMFGVFSPVGAGISGKGNTGKLIQVDASPSSNGSLFVVGGNVAVPPFAAATTTDSTPIQIGVTSYAISAVPTDPTVGWSANSWFPSMVVETGSMTELTYGAIASGDLLGRSGAGIIGFASTGFASSTRTLTAGAGMTGGGDLSADRTFNVVANADGTIVVNADDVQAGVMQTANIAADAVTLTKIVNFVTDSFPCRDTAGTGDLEVCAVGGGIEFTGGPGIQSSAYTGDVTKAAGGTVLTIAADSVTNAKAANMPTATFKGRITAGTGDPEDLTGTQATTLLDLFTSSLKGLAPASGGGSTNFLRADGTWAAPAGSGGTVTSVSGTATRISSTGGATPVIDLVNTAVTPGSYTYAGFTVDAAGRLTAASSGATPALAARTLTGTSPILIEGDHSAHDLSANRTISLATVSGFRMLSGDSGGTAFSFSDEIRLDNDSLWISNDGSLVVQNGGAGSFQSATYERARTYWSSNVYHIAMEKAGGGTSFRPMEISDFTDLTASGTGTFGISYSSVQINTTNNSLGMTDADGFSFFSNGVARASSSGAVGDVMVFDVNDISITGTTPITTATGFNSHLFKHANYITPGAGVSVSAAATVAIDGPPAAGTNVTITKGYGLWVQASRTRFDGDGTAVFELPNDATGNVSAAVGRVAVNVTGVGTRYLRLYND